MKKKIETNVPKKVMELTMEYAHKCDSLLTARRRAWRKYNYLKDLEGFNPAKNIPIQQ